MIYTQEIGGEKKIKNKIIINNNNNNNKNREIGKRK